MVYKILITFLLATLIVSCNSGNANQSSNESIGAKLEKDSLQLMSETSEEQPEENTYIATALKELNINYEDCHTSYITEKVLPYDTDKSVVVIPKIAEKDEADCYSMDAYIVVIDHHTKEIVHQFYEKKAWTSDAMQFKGITIDTAPYKLNSSVRAFGVKVSYEGSSRVNPYYETLMSLFVPQGKKLVRIMKDYPVSLSRGEFGVGCEGYSENTGTIFIMSEKQTNGYNDIITKGTIETTVYKNNDEGDDCEENISTEYKTDTIKYQEGKYYFERSGY